MEDFATIPLTLWKISGALSTPTMPTANEKSAPDALERLLKLSHELGREERRLAMLGEGNTSTRVSDGTFIVNRLRGALGFDPI